MNELTVMLGFAIAIASYFTIKIMYPYNRIYAGIIIILIGLIFGLTGGTLTTTEQNWIDDNGNLQNLGITTQMTSTSIASATFYFALIIIGIGLMIIILEIDKGFRRKLW